MCPQLLNRRSHGRAEARDGAGTVARQRSVDLLPLAPKRERLPLAPTDRRGTLTSNSRREPEDGVELDERELAGAEERVRCEALSTRLRDCLLSPTPSSA